MRNLKIGARLALGFFCVLILMAGIGGVGAWGLQTIHSASSKLLSETDEEIKVGNWLERTRVNGERAVAMVMLTAPEDVAIFAKAMTQTSREITNIQKEFESQASLNPDRKKFLEELAAKRKTYVDVRNDVTQLLKTDNAAARKMIYEKMIPARDAYVGVLESWKNHENAATTKTMAELGNTYNLSRNILYGLCAVTIIACIVLALSLTMGITRPLNEAVKVAQTVASGDLTSTIAVNSRDETGQLMLALKHMNESLIQATSKVRDSAEAIATASAEIAQGNQDLSSRTEHQASSLEETASSMEELTSTVRQNGDNARQANQLSANAAQVAHRNGELAQQVMQTMNDIHESSRKIVDIISVIDGIAFQTNILALNASVEAARAGEQGRGFAVVAGEVRNLAQRSASAAREIKTLIDDSVSKVENGRKLVNASGETMQEMVTSIQNVNDIMTEISAATQEQVAGIEQVNQAVTEMDTVSQQNAALVEEAAAAAESLRDQAAVLVGIAGQFKLTPGSVKAVATAPSRVPVKAAAISQSTQSPRATPKTSGSMTGGKPPASHDGDWEEF